MPRFFVCLGLFRCYGGTDLEVAVTGGVLSSHSVLVPDSLGDLGVGISQGLVGGGNSGPGTPGAALVRPALNKISGSAGGNHPFKTEPLNAGLEPFAILWFKYLYFAKKIASRWARVSLSVFVMLWISEAVKSPVTSLLLKVLSDRSQSRATTETVKPASSIISSIVSYHTLLYPLNREYNLL